MGVGLLTAMRQSVSLAPMNVPETHTCPRRMSDFGPWKREEGLDTYTARSGLIGQPRGCSFCGSMHPDDFMEHIRAGRPISACDKSYKLYVEQIPRNGDPTDLRVVSHSISPSSNLRPWGDLNRAEKKAVRAYDHGFLKNYGRSVKDEYWAFTPWGETVEGKFYTAHLSPVQGHEFWALHLEHKVNWSYPLYRPLYVPGPSDAEPTK